MCDYICPSHKADACTGATCANGTMCVAPRADSTVGVCSDADLLPLGITWQ